MDASPSPFLYTGDDFVPLDVVHVVVHESIKVIPSKTFQHRSNLHEVHLPEGLCAIDEWAFHGCSSLGQISLPSTLKYISSGVFQSTALSSIVIPSSVVEIGEEAFSECEKLTCVKIQEGGLRRLGSGVFSSCKSLTQINIPSTIKAIPRHAFDFCTSLSVINIPDNVETIGSRAFGNCALSQLRFPPGLKEIEYATLTSCMGLFSIEVPENLKAIDLFTSTLCLHSLRNIATPPKCKLGPQNEPVGDFQKRLKRRFRRLPIHEKCYYQSYCPVEVTLRDLKRIIEPRWPRKKWNKTGDQGDHFGCRMTPLHILACSTTHHVELYQLIIERYPKNLVTKDSLGGIPLLYALWGNAPPEIVHLLVEGQKRYFPDNKVDGVQMATTLCRANAPLENINKLLNTLEADFPEHQVDWQKAVIKLSQWHIPIKPFRFMLKYSISSHLHSLGVAKWQFGIENIIDKFPEHALRRTERVKLLYSMLASYEQLKEITSLIELAVWRQRLINV